mmetsp:Transcript_46152/g.73347  ORF Transcript_46152/g.73347 Transcript_46152/m.73347 type:complete len:238 (+) Transcript_46152:92-805(+)
MDVTCSLLQQKVAASRLLFPVLHRLRFVDARPEVRGVTTEGDLELRQELVHALQQGHRCRCHAVNAGSAIVDDDPICQIRRHDEVVFHDEGGLFGMQDKPLHHAGGHDALFDIKVRGGFIDQVDIRRLPQREHQSHSLQFATTQCLYIVVGNLIDEHGLCHISLKLRMQKRISDLPQEQVLDCTIKLGADGLRFVGHIELGQFITFFQIVGFQQAGEHSDEGSLASPILPQEDQNFA